VPKSVTNYCMVPKLLDGTQQLKLGRSTYMAKCTPVVNFATGQHQQLTNIGRQSGLNLIKLLGAYLGA